MREADNSESTIARPRYKTRCTVDRRCTSARRYCHHATVEHHYVNSLPSGERTDGDGECDGAGVTHRNKFPHITSDKRIRGTCLSVYSSIPVTSGSPRRTVRAIEAE